MKTYTAAAKAFYKSAIWKKTRDLYAASVDGLCERCRARGVYNPGKIVHHRIYLDDRKLMDNSIALSFDNLELLCQTCHNAEHGDDDRSDIRYMFSSDGRLIEKR